MAELPWNVKRPGWFAQPTPWERPPSEPLPEKKPKPGYLAPKKD